MALAEFRVEFKDIPGHSQHAVVFASGEIDMSNADAFAEAIAQAWEDSPELVTVDLEAVSFIGSDGINILISALRLARESDGELLLRRPSKRVQRVLEITGLHTRFEIVDEGEGRSTPPENWSLDGDRPVALHAPAMPDEPYTSTACFVGEHELCGRRIVRNCPCWCHEDDSARPATVGDDGDG